MADTTEALAKLLVKNFLSSHGVKPEYDKGKIEENMETDCIRQMAAAESVSLEGANEIVQGWADKWGHVWEEPIDDIPAEEMEDAFGEGGTPDKQGRLVKKYKLPRVEANAKRWGTALGSTKRGINPDRKAETKAPTNDAPTENKNNPWSDQYRCSRPPRDASDRQRQILEAQAAVIRRFGSAGAIRYARSAGKTLGNQPLAKR